MTKSKWFPTIFFLWIAQFWCRTIEDTSWHLFACNILKVRILVIVYLLLFPYIFKSMCICLLILVSWNWQCPYTWLRWSCFSFEGSIKPVRWSFVFGNLTQVNASPYENGWIVKVKMGDTGELNSLMDSEQYSKFCEEEDAKHWGFLDYKWFQVSEALVAHAGSCNTPPVQ